MSLEAEEWILEYWDKKWVRHWEFAACDGCSNHNGFDEIFYEPPPMKLQDAMMLAKREKEAFSGVYRVRNTRTGDILPEVIL